MNKEIQLTQILRETTAALRATTEDRNALRQIHEADSILVKSLAAQVVALVQERDTFKTDRDEWKDATLSANERFKKAEDALWKMRAERDALKDENRLLRDALMKACGDDEDNVNICIESQRS